MKNFIISVILDIFIDSRIYSCLLWLSQARCTIHQDIKFFPGKEVGVEDQGNGIGNH